MGIDRVPIGGWADIVAIDHEWARQQLIRLGFEEGARVEVISRIPLGPVILRRRDRQVAIGRQVASAVRVKLV